MDVPTQKAIPSKLAYRIPEACAAIGLGRSKLYELINDGTIKTSLVGGRRVVPVQELERLIERGMQAA
jgi:excisionase family DNA binding protein